MRNYIEDIICARATPIGQSAIAIIRISGKDSHSLLKKIFKPSKSLNLDNYKSHKAYYGDIYDDEIIDNVLIITYREGASFTDEESFEINCHGSDLVVSLIIKLLLKNGCRLAEGGEFSKRAFLNGKIDLTEAEAIMDIVNSSSIEGVKIANRQLNGRLRGEIDSIKEELSNLLANIEVLIDYPEEDLEYNYEIWKDRLKTILNSINILQRDFNRGRAYRDGINSVIIGKTNVGKSTFFNLLLNEDKAIVSEIAGTTRDYIDSIINISGIPVKIFDTAGLRETNDIIEKEGTKRTKELSKKAEVIIYLIDTITLISNDDIENIKNIDDKKIIFVINKIDLVSEPKVEEIEKTINNIMKTKNNRYKIVRVSALKKEGVEDFNNKFLELNFGEKIIERDDPIITNERHYNLLDEAKKSIIEIENININELDILAYHIRDALNYIGEITGEVSNVDILNKIFSSFCVGK
jgi:tRNA modification GTPase